MNDIVLFLILPLVNVYAAKKTKLYPLVSCPSLRRWRLLGDSDFIGTEANCATSREQRLRDRQCEQPETANWRACARKAQQAPLRIASTFVNVGQRPSLKQ